jgi:hypothetical protein
MESQLKISLAQVSHIVKQFRCFDFNKFGFRRSDH